MELQDWQGHSDFNARLAGFETVTHDENGKAITHLPKILEGD